MSCGVVARLVLKEKMFDSYAAHDIAGPWLGEGTVFSLFASPHLDWGGGGTPIPGQDRGYRHPGSG